MIYSMFYEMTEKNPIHHSIPYTMIDYSIVESKYLSSRG